MKKDYTNLTGQTFAEMRLLLEGAIVLYEGDAAHLYERASGCDNVKIAFSDIGSALYLLLEKVKMLEAAQCNDARGV